MKLGFIGCGNMAGAIMGGIIKNQVFKPEEIIGSDVFVPTREKARDQYGIQITDSNLEVVEKSEDRNHHRAWKNTGMAGREIRQESKDRKNDAEHTGYGDGGHDSSIPESIPV